METQNQNASTAEAVRATTAITRELLEAGQMCPQLLRHRLDIPPEQLPLNLGQYTRRLIQSDLPGAIATGSPKQWGKVVNERCAAYELAITAQGIQGKIPLKVSRYEMFLGEAALYRAMVLGASEWIRQNYMPPAMKLKAFTGSKPRGKIDYIADPTIHLSAADASGHNELFLFRIVSDASRYESRSDLSLALDVESFSCTLYGRENLAKVGLFVIQTGSHVSGSYGYENPLVRRWKNSTGLLVWHGKTSDGRRLSKGWEKQVLINKADIEQWIEGLLGHPDNDEAWQSIISYEELDPGWLLEKQLPHANQLLESIGRGLTDSAPARHYRACNFPTACEFRDRCWGEG